MAGQQQWACLYILKTFLVGLFLICLFQLLGFVTLSECRKRVSPDPPWFLHHEEEHHSDPGWSTVSYVSVILCRKRGVLRIDYRQIIVLQCSISWWHRHLWLQRVITHIFSEQFEKITDGPFGTNFTLRTGLPPLFQPYLTWMCQILSSLAPN